MTGKADRKCCVPDCGNTRSEDVTLHVFPNPDNEPDRFRTWLYAIGGDILALDNMKIFKHCKVCHAHFEQQFYTSSKRLAANAIPSLHLTDKGILDPRSKETADIILFFDNQSMEFDSVNGGHQNLKRRSGKPLLVPLTPTSPHQKVWSHSKNVPRTMKYVDERGRFCVVPSINNWIHTIENLEYLRNQLFAKHELRSIWLRHFNQDPLENFFGCIRSHGARNTNPTCASFETAFASLLINSLNSVHSPGANCEKDSCQTFKSLSIIFFNKMDQTRSNENEINFEHVSDHILVGIENKMSNPKIMAQIEYVTGYVLRKIKNIFKRCMICCKDLYDLNRLIKSI